MSNYCKDIPVLMYHSVGVINKEWSWNYLTCPFYLFEEQLKAIRNLGYTTISMNKLYLYMVKGEDIPIKSIVITFDDGYSDIWTFAYPLLKKYGMCGTVFINPDFVDKRNIKRKIFSEGHDISKLENMGFLSWEEIITMDYEGVIYSESHALTHTWYPNTNKIIDFRHPNDPYIWMTWNSNKELKHILQIDNSKYIKYGAPVYQHDKSLSSPRYYPDQKLDNTIIKFVIDNGGDSFFSQKEWRSILFKEVENFKRENILDEIYEGNSDYEERLRHELKFTKEILEEKLQREINILCWPGGSATKIGMSIAKELGYVFFNTARDMTTQERSNIKNIKYGGDRVQRFTPLMYFNGQENKNSQIEYANYFWMKIIFSRQMNVAFSKYWFKFFSLNIQFYFILRNKLLMMKKKMNSKN